MFFDDEFPGIGLVVAALGIICDLRAKTGMGVCGFKIIGAAIGMQRVGLFYHVVHGVTRIGVSGVVLVITGLLQK